MNKLNRNIVFPHIVCNIYHFIFDLSESSIFKCNWTTNMDASFSHSPKEQYLVDVFHIDSLKEQKNGLTAPERHLHLTLFMY